MSTWDQSLLLLPAFSLPFQRSSLRSTYQVTFEKVLQLVKPSNVSSISRLDVGILTDGIHSATSSRTDLFQRIQLSLEELYTLICLTASQHNIELDVPGGIDVRIFFIDRSTDNDDSGKSGKRALDGPLIDGLTLVRAKRNYSNIYVPSGEVNQRAVDRFMSIWRDEGDTIPTSNTVPCGSSDTTSGDFLQFNTSPSTTTHTRVIVGGTFDHLHIGHKLLLTALIFVAQPGDSPQPREITVGITGDELLVNKKFASSVESWDERQQNTAGFMESVLVFHPDVPSIRKVEHFDNPGPNGKVVKVTYNNEVILRYTQISDPYGPTITDESLTAIVISEETRAGGKAVNDRRTEKGWHTLEVFEVDVLDASSGDDSSDNKAEKETFESKISSTEIRKRLEQKSSNATRL